MNKIVKLFPKLHRLAVANQIRQQHYLDCPVGNSSAVIDWYINREMPLFREATFDAECDRETYPETLYPPMPGLLREALTAQANKPKAYYLEECYRQRAINEAIMQDVRHCNWNHNRLEQRNEEVTGQLQELEEERLGYMLSALPQNRPN